MEADGAEVLRELHLHGWAVIDDAELELGPGLTVLTGETGTGKTTVLTALSLLMGGRPDAGLLRVGVDRLSVDGVWSGVPHQAIARVDDAGGAVDNDGSLVVRRTVGGEGRSRAFAGGASVPVGVLADVGDELAAVHGQSDQLLLRRPSLQRDLLDRFAGVKHLEVVSRHARLWREALDLAARLDELTSRGKERQAARDEATSGVALIDELNPLPGEDIELKAESIRLENVDGLHEAAADALAALAGRENSESSGDASAAIGAARRALAGAAQHDPELQASQKRLDEVSILLDDVASELRAYIASLDVDPGRIDVVQQRRGRLSDLARRIGSGVQSVDDLLHWRERAMTLLAEPEDREQIDALRRKAAEIDATIASSAATITSSRRKAALKLGRAVTAELQALAMPKARLEVQVSDAELGPTGSDDVLFALVPRAEANPVPLHKGASGGELSRVMLALEVVLAGADPVGTFVFDEVDAGVGGRAAVDVGRRLAALGRTSQVIVVTHLPQVAAFADQHLVVERADGASRAAIRPLDAAERIGELTRMLAGLADSQAGRAHAEELLATATELKQEARA